MTNAEKKVWLNRYRPLVREIGVLREEYERVMSIGTKVTALYSDMPQSGRQDKVQSAVERLEAIQSNIIGKIKEMAAARGEITAAIDAVPQEHLRELLYRRYIKGESFKEIAATMHYNYRWVQRLHARALAIVEPNRPS